jgi:hypothetical protein
MHDGRGNDVAIGRIPRQFSNRVPRAVWLPLQLQSLL